MAADTSDAPHLAGTVLDHVAHAVPRWHDVWRRYATDLGAAWASGGPGPGFAPGQLRFANGARVEVLMPWDTGVNDFLARFLAHNGPGPHHLTFKVPAIDHAIAEARRFGIEPVNIDTSDPEWREAFLHPKEAGGVVVQLAEAPHAWSSPPPDDYPTDRRLRLDGSGPTAPATLQRVCHVVADLDAARALFGGLLAGETVGQGSLDGIHWVDLRWAGPLGLRLVGAEDPGAAGPVTEWLGGLPGRVHHLAFAVEEPDGVPGARPADPGIATLGPGSGTERTFEIPGDANFGLGIVLAGSDGPGGTADPPFGGPVA
ncbi:MAG TPA: VOC family protein [Acidimicrobiales bacterium]|nr:VOC family protein [Acidimicrobiales bacterium]